MTTYRVGITAPTVNMLPVWLARAGGLFAARGLEVEIVVTDGGSRGLVSVGAGKLEAMIVGLSAVIDANGKANGKNGDFRLIAAAANTMSFGFFGAADARDAQSLRGRKVGVSAFGSESDSAATLALRRLGLRRCDVTMVEFGATLRRLDGLHTGALQATALNAPANILAARAGLPQLADLAQDEPWIFTGVVVDKGTLGAQRPTMTNFLRAFVEGIHLALSDEEQAKAVLAAEFRALDADILQATYDDFKRRVPRDAAPSREGIANMMQELPKLGFEVRSQNVADYVDFSLNEELRGEGFFDVVRRRYATEW